jgi:hypothetical protein
VALFGVQPYDAPLPADFYYDHILTVSLGT